MKTAKRLTDNKPAYTKGKYYKILNDENPWLDMGTLYTIENDMDSQYTYWTCNYDFSENWIIDEEVE